MLFNFAVYKTIFKTFKTRFIGCYAPQLISYILKNNNFADFSVFDGGFPKFLNEQNFVQGTFFWSEMEFKEFKPRFKSAKIRQNPV